MTATSFLLDEHWRTFIDHQVVTGRYASATEVIEAGLRQLEAQDEKLTRLRAHLAEGIAEADAGDFVDDYSIDAIMAEADQSGGRD